MHKSSNINFLNLEVHLENKMRLDFAECFLQFLLTVWKEHYFNVKRIWERISLKEQQ